MESPRFEVQSEFPCGFECTSGEFLFGQMQCIVEGMETNLHDGMNGPTGRLPGGTIIQNDFRYRTAARAGRWVVSRIYVAHQDGSDDHSHTQDRRFIGYVLHHEDVSSIEYVHRASMVGISNGNKHSDKNIVYVNRYDWSWHHGKRSMINVALGPGHPYIVPQLNDLMAGRLIVIDASRAQSFINTVRSFYLQRVCYSLSAMPNEVAYGIHLDSAGNMPAYELGWLGFSGEKHAKFPESDELVAIVYDPAYTGLSGLEPTEVLMVENVVARTGAEVAEDEEDPDDEDYEESDGGSATDSSESSGTSNDMLEEDEVASLALPDPLPPPSISEISHLSGLTVMISGSTLSLATSVFFEDELASFNIKSNTLIEAYAPPGVTGKVGVKVLGPGGTSNIFEYTHVIVATINSLTPDNGPRWGGNVVVILGHHLERTTDIMFGDLPAVAFEIVSDTQINATAPAGFPFASYPDVTLRTPYEVGKGHRYVYRQPHETAPVDPNYDAAITTWQREINKDPNAWSARCELAEVYNRKNDLIALIGLWKEAVQLEPKNTTALDNLAKAYAWNGNFKAAIRAWKTAMDEGADEKHIFLGLADAYHATGDKEASVDMTNEATRMWPTSDWY